MSYLEAFGLSREAFSNAPDARFYFNSEQHSQALIRLMHAVDTNKGLAILLGGVGTGKTTLARRMLDKLSEEEYESSLLVMVHSELSPGWVLTRIAMQLGVEEPAEDRLSLLRQLYGRLLQIHDSGKKAVVLIDEAQMLQTQAMMEAFRGLLNLELPNHKLLNIVFFGLPSLEDCLRLDEPLAQRVATRFHLDAFTLDTTESYIKHRLRIAGAKKMLFYADVIPIIHQYSRGIPRLINTMCDNSLFEAYLRKMDIVNVKVVHGVAVDLGLSEFSPKVQAAVDATQLEAQLQG